MDVIFSDFSGVPGSHCYCSEEAESAISGEISRMPVRAVHILGSGDRHYLSLLWLRRISEPFILILLDNHPDDQQDAFSSGILSCGSWMLRARELPMLEWSAWIRTAGDADAAAEKMSAAPLTEFPVYFSIDLDVLSPAHATTDWDQGEMTLEQLCAILRRLSAGRKVLGADICGAAADSGRSPGDNPLHPNEHCLQEILGIW